VEHHVNIIKSKPEAEKLHEISVCNVLDLSRFDENSFDAVLCMGAMYHLPTDDEKAQAIWECTGIC
jgi:predicted SAM-dependent methyltransferase